MKQDRFLTGILIGIAVLIAAALAVFFARQNQATYISDQTPDGVVHDYVVAVLKKDYQKAYGYLADLDNKPTYDEFRQAFAVGRLNPVIVGEVVLIQVGIRRDSRIHDPHSLAMGVIHIDGVTSLRAHPRSLQCVVVRVSVVGRDEQVRKPL